VYWRACASRVASCAAGVTVREAGARRNNALSRPRVAARSQMSGASFPAAKADECDDERARPRSRHSLRAFARLELGRITRYHTGSLIATVRAPARCGALTRRNQSMVLQIRREDQLVRPRLL
jgi:hypothetical protein